MAADPEAKRTEDAQQGSTAAGILGLLIIVGLMGGAIWLLWPPPITTQKDAGFASQVFASRIVVFAARLLVLSAAIPLAVGAAFVVASILKLWQHGQWFTRFGPFEASKEAIGELAEQYEYWQEQALSAISEQDELRARLEETDETLAAVYGRLLELESEEDPDTGRPA